MKCYALKRKDDEWSGRWEIIGIYSTEELANEAMRNAAKAMPDFWSFRIESMPFDWMFLSHE